MAIDPRGKDLKALLADDPGGPVAMLNLLRFTDEGRASHQVYETSLSKTFLPKYGGRLLTEAVFRSTIPWTW